jgi:DNA-binding CsgD family transcriptional regulator
VAADQEAMAVERQQTARAFMRAQFVGREPELAMLAACLAESLSGQPRIVLCRGEAGIGKTRLAEELLTRARAEGALGVWGAADESVGLPPFWPWSRAFRAIGQALDLKRLASEHNLTTDLARVAPDVFAVAGEIESSAASTDDRVRQFDAVAQMLRLICQSIPVAIVLEDAHWADEPSLLLLAHIVRGLTDERLLLMVNARDLEHRRGERLSQLVRQPSARLLELHGLAESDVRQQLRNVLGRGIEEAELARMFAQTGGNPFLVQEAGRALASGYAHGDAPIVTPTLRDAIGSRLDHLSELSVHVIESASVLGQEFSAALLASMLDLPPLDALAAVDEAQRAALLEPGTRTDEFRFVHALVRDAIAAGLKRPDRVHLHALAAQAILRQYPNPVGRHLFDLAHHLAEAALEGDPAIAAGWSERAASEALSQLAYEEAARLFAQALRVGGTHLEEKHRCRLLLAEANALNLSGDLGGRMRCALDAAAIARALQRTDLLAEAALVMDATGLAGFDLVTRRLCQEALAGLDEHSTAMRARLTARFAESFIYLSDTDAAEQASRHALELAEACKDPLALAAALRARQVVCAGPDGLDMRMQMAESMLTLSQRNIDPRMEFSARCWRIDVWFERGDFGRIAAELDTLDRCASELGGPVARFTVLHTRAALAQAQARFADAQRLIDDAFAALTATDYAQRFYVRAAILGFVGHHLGQNAATLAATGMSDAPPSETIVNAPMIGPIAHAHALTEAGRLEEAANIYRSLGPVADWRPPPHVVLLVQALGIGIASALRETSDVATLRAGLLPYRGHHVVSGIGAMSYFGPVELWVGVAAAFLGLLDEAVVDLDQAEQICRANGAVGFQIESMCELATVLTRRGRPEDVHRARQLLGDTAPRAVQLGMRPIAARIELLKELLGSGARLPLTERELEVAQLVAEGLTNRQIGERLIISERTAQNHVQHILTKLGLANRSQIARMIATRK